MPPKPNNLRWAGRLDMYRKIPADLMEGTRRGSFLSYFAVVVLLALFLMETGAYFRKRPVTYLSLDSNKDRRIRVNFNITMMDMPCEYAVIDLVSVLGTEQNVSSYVSKWRVDAAGVRQRYQGRNREQKDIQLYDPAVGKIHMDDLYKNGESAIHLNAETFEYALDEQEYLFVDFYASWCSHCRDLAPTWETLAQVMTDVAEHIVNSTQHDYDEEELEHAKKVELPVMIAKVDCVIHQQLCAEQRIMGYPSLRLFVDGERWRGGDYTEHRTVVEMVDWLEQIEHVHKSELGTDAAKNVGVARRSARKRMGLDEGSDSENEWIDKVKRHKQSLHHAWVDEDHPGCQLAGHLLMERAPGHFAIMARSPHHEIEAKMTNVSHVVHALTIGDPIAYKMIERHQVSVPQGVEGKFTPMNGFAYLNDELHEAYHHYLKVITTDVDGLRYGKKDLKVYQILESSQLAYYTNDQIPSAKWILDLSPIAVSYRTTSRHWYEYVTSVMALIGGTFTLIGLIESSMGAIVSRRKSPYR